jgi:predicted SprT family Zn-dependent metalloprotease
MVCASMKQLRGDGTQHVCQEVVVVELAHYLLHIQDN